MSALDRLLSDPGGIAADLQRDLRRLGPDVTDGELVYGPGSKHSYYSDFLLQGTSKASPGTEERLGRHAEQMDRIGRDRQVRVLRSSHGRFEFRVTPGRTDGYGGYFSPPAWLNQLFATANRPGRVLSGLMSRFPLPAGVSSINTPLIGTGTTVTSSQDGGAVPDQDFNDSATSSTVVPFVGQADMALQDLEQSPPGAHMDWVIFQDLSEALDNNLETQLLTGTGGSTPFSPLLGVLNITGSNAVTYTSGSPTGSAMWPYLGKAAAQVGDNRLRPPECWIMRTARWAWFQSSEDTATRPFGISTEFYLGSDENTPDPVGGLMGWPVFLSDAVPATLTGNPGAFTTTAGTQDVVLCLRPTDMILLLGDPRTSVDREPLSATLGVRLQMHCNAAALMGRRATGVSVVGGTGLTLQAGY